MRRIMGPPTGWGFFAVVNALFREGRYAAKAFGHNNDLFQGATT
jgi:hypothetical protein